MGNPSSPTVTRIAILPLLTTAPHGVGTLGILRNRNLGPQSAGIRMSTGLVTRIAKRIAIGNVTGPGRETSGMVWNGPTSALHNTKTTRVNAAAPTSVNVRVDMKVILRTTRQSRGTGPALVHRVAAGHTPPNVDCCHLHPFPIQHL